MGTGSKVATVVIGCCALLGVLAMTPIFVILIAMGGSESATGAACLPGAGTLPASGLPEGFPGSDAAVGEHGLTARQESVVATVIDEGERLLVPAQGLVVALAVARQESGFKVYANDGGGGDLAADQAGIGRSLDYPHDAVGTDHGSLGVFQQQWPWWGSMEQLMDPRTSARLFFEALVKVPGWQTMPVTVAAQSVQRSAYPDAYADDEPVARQLVAAYAGAGSLSVPATGEGGGVGCVQSGGILAGTVTFPIPKDSSYVDQRNFAAQGSNWSSWHTGTDLSVACGTKVFAATSGQVVVETDAAWAGPWLVKVSTGEGKLTTWYAHMQQVLVENGQQVRAGEQIGEVGNMGNSRGCHLHFEVHPTGGSIYEDPVDPTAWLEKNVGEFMPGDQAGPAGASGSPVAEPGSGKVRVATFNVLGTHHSAPGGSREEYAGGAIRTRSALEVIEAAGIEIVALQEFETSQAEVVEDDGEWSVLRGSPNRRFPNGTTSSNAIAWRAATWQLQAWEEIEVPTRGRMLHMPVALLQHRGSGDQVVVVGVHNPVERSLARRARARERAYLEQLVASTSAPVLVLGDFNERASAFCGLTEGGLLSAAAGGANPAGSGCRPPAYRQVDWVFGARVRFGGSRVDHSVRGEQSDHPLVYATATLSGQTSKGRTP